MRNRIGIKINPETQYTDAIGQIVNRVHNYVLERDDKLSVLLNTFLFVNPPTDASRAGDKYETSSTNVGYSKFMKLKIRTVGPGDFGSYRCVAKNSLGETDGLIKLDGNPLLTYFSITFTETHTHMISLFWHRTHRTNYGQIG